MYRWEGNFGREQVSGEKMTGGMSEVETRHEEICPG